MRVRAGLPFKVEVTVVICLFVGGRSSGLVVLKIHVPVGDSVPNLHDKKYFASLFVRTAVSNFLTTWYMLSKRETLRYMCDQKTYKTPLFILLWPLLHICTTQKRMRRFSMGVDGKKVLREAV
jgi:hypothetical protein